MVGPTADTAEPPQMAVLTQSKERSFQPFLIFGK
jgi:hypothetical protein